MGVFSLIANSELHAEGNKSTQVVLDSQGNFVKNVTTVRWGPINMPAAGPDGPGELDNEIVGVSGLFAWVYDLFASVGDYEVTKPCENCFITKITPNMVLPDGTPVNFNNMGMLHHAVNVNFSKPDVTCRPMIGDLINLLGLFAGGNQRFFASGNERTPVGMAPGYGYEVKAGDQWGLIYHLMNMMPVERTFYLEYTFEWVPGGMEGVRPIWLDVDACNDAEYASPAGYSDKQYDWLADRSATLVHIGGHVHDYGISIALENASENQHIFTSVAGYAAGSSFVPIGPGSGADAAHPVSANTVSYDPLGLINYMGHTSDMTNLDDVPPNGHFQKWNTLRLHTQYNQPNASDHNMGIMVGYVDEDFCITNFWCF
jgi:hypothetical protein